VISIRSLRKLYGDFVAVDGLDMTVEPGDIYGFLGPNGAGKSTTIRMMLSLVAPTSGTIEIFGQNLQTHRHDILRRIGAIVERPDFYNYLTAYKNLELLGRLSGADISKKNIMRVLGIVGLDTRHNSKVKTFSHGMKQRLGIAQTLLHDPDLIVLDEPTTGLDPHGMVDVRELILSLSADLRKTVVLSSHILPEVELTATRMIIIAKGKAIIEGSVRELLDAGRMKVTIETPSADAAIAAIGSSPFANTLQGRSEHGCVLQLERAEIPEVVRLLVERGIALESVTPVRSLEATFMGLTQEAA